MALRERPRLRHTDEDGERRATWLELFFDLVFVVAVAQLAGVLSADPTLGGFLEFTGLFAPIWWAWIGFTFYADRFDTDDVLHRLLMLAGMFAVATLAVYVPDAAGDGARSFTVAYLAVRGLVIVLNSRAWRHVPEARPLLTAYLGGFGAGWLVWASSLLVDAPARYWLWGVGTAIEIGTPLVSRRLIQAAPIHASHIPERMGLFIIIVLGESVLAVVVGVSDVEFGPRSALVAGAAFAVAACCWWLYFDYLDSSVILRSVPRGQVYVYGHFALAVGITALGAGTKLAIKEARADSLNEGTAWIVCGGVALTLGAMALIQLAGAATMRDVAHWLRAGAAAAALALAPAGSHLAPPVMLGLLAVVLVVPLVFELARHEGHSPAPAAG